VLEKFDSVLYQYCMLLFLRSFVVLGNTTNDDRLTRCHQNMKLSKRQKILAVLNSVLEKKRKESSEGDVGDGSYHCLSSTSIEPVLKECDSVSSRSKTSRKRTIGENNISMTYVKKPLLETPSSFSKRFNVKTGFGAIGHETERSACSSKSLLGSGAFPDASSGKVFAGNYLKSAEHLQGCSTKVQTTIAPRLCPDSRFNRTSFRSGDHIRLPSLQTRRDIRLQQFRVTRVPVIRQVKSIYHRDADHYSASISPRFDELDVRPSRSPQFDELNVRVDSNRGLLGDRPPSSERFGLLGDAPRSSSSNFPLQDRKSVV